MNPIFLTSLAGGPPRWPPHCPPCFSFGPKLPFFFFLTTHGGICLIWTILISGNSPPPHPPSFKSSHPLPSGLSPSFSSPILTETFLEPVSSLLKCFECLFPILPSQNGRTRFPLLSPLPPHSTKPYKWRIVFFFLKDVCLRPSLFSLLPKFDPSLSLFRHPFSHP